MAYTYLDITNEVLRHVNEVPLTSADFANATGVRQDAKDAVNRAIIEINSQEVEWPFNYVRNTVTADPNKTDPHLYTLPATIKTTDWDTIVLRRDTNLNVEERHLRYIVYEDWVKNYRASDENGSANVPRLVFRTPDNNLGLSPAPDKAYTIEYSAYLLSTPLSLFDDVPVIPSEYRNVIFTGAIMYMHRFRDNVELADREQRMFDKGIKRMRRTLINQYERVVPPSREYFTTTLKSSGSR